MLHCSNNLRALYLFLVVLWVDYLCRLSIWHFDYWPLYRLSLYIRSILLMWMAVYVVCMPSMQLVMVLSVSLIETRFSIEKLNSSPVSQVERINCFVSVFLFRICFGWSDKRILTLGDETLYFEWKINKYIWDIVWISWSIS